MPHDPFNLLERNPVLRASNNVTYIFINLTTERARMNYTKKKPKSVPKITTKEEKACMLIPLNKTFVI